MTRINYHNPDGSICVAEFEELENITKFSIFLRVPKGNNIVIYRTVGEAKSFQDAEVLAESYSKKMFALLKVDLGGEL